MLGATKVPGQSAREIVAGWADYKVGLAAALALHAAPGDVRYGELRVDERDSFGRGIFPGGLKHVLASTGAAFTAPGGITAYVLIDGNIVVSKPFSDDRMTVFTRVPEHVLNGLQRTTRVVHMNRFMEDETMQLAKRYSIDASYLRSLILLTCLHCFRLVM